MPTRASSAAEAELDRDGSGFYITFVIEEGELYKFGAVEDGSSRCPASMPDALRGQMLTVAGDDLQASQIDKTMESAHARRRPSRVTPSPASARAPRRDPGARTIGVTYVVDEGPRIYIERINIIGNYAHQAITSSAASSALRKAMPTTR